ncbi:MAG: hypothetical protein KGJ89_04550 [Patescibacteria group bacterium]|nr:hypothetical protein [Patescibacteria group bacterium]MDE2015822.1 hypothetical protein [Patescibacteria group bacterium]MDE2227197.1 hypothetical protein [Patescibacteria group bacterium]
MRQRFLLSALFAVIAVILEARLNQFLGIGGGLLVAALVVPALFIDFLEIIFLTLAVLFFLNWQPAFSWDIFILGIFPLGVFWSKRLIRWKSWVIVPVAIFLGILVLYLIFERELLLSAPIIFARDVIIGLIFGFSEFAVLNKDSFTSI